MFARSGRRRRPASAGDRIARLCDVRAFGGYAHLIAGSTPIPAYPQPADQRLRLARIKKLPISGRDEVRRVDAGFGLGRRQRSAPHAERHSYFGSGSAGRCRFRSIVSVEICVSSTGGRTPCPLSVHSFDSHLLLRHAEANAEAVAGVGVALALQAQADGAAGVAGDVEVVAAATDRPVVLFGEVQLFVTPCGVEVVEDDFPDAAAHVGQSKTVATHFTVVVDR